MSPRSSTPPRDCSLPRPTPTRTASSSFENFRLVSPAWRPHLAAAATFSFLGADAPDTPAILRIREAIAK
jgi:hypothetical protein